MNIQKIFDAVKDDDINSPLPSIIWELEHQGYTVKLEGVDVTSNDIEDNLFSDLEKSANEFNIELLNNGLVEQIFKIKFFEYHKFCFLQA